MVQCMNSGGLSATCMASIPGLVDQYATQFGLSCRYNDIVARCPSSPKLNIPVDGGYTSWSAWQGCSASCGPTLTKTRTRTCTNPAPAHNGAQCSGPASDTQNCGLPNCPVHGNWGQWSSFGACSKQCGPGKKTRTRQCDSPAPLHGGNQCAGSGSEDASCNLKPCAVDGMWGSWSAFAACTATCGAGTQTRTRQCDSPAPANGGKDCVGSASESPACNKGACPVNGGWSAYVAGACDKSDVSCDEGTQVYTRTCTNPSPSNGGSQCSGSATEKKTCNSQICKAVCNFGDFRCNDEVTCLTSAKRCDKTNDCAGGEDEQNCDTQNLLNNLNNDATTMRFTMLTLVAQVLMFALAKLVTV